MNAEVVDALLWVVAASARYARVGVGVGHGYADPDHRPPVAPFASVVGPLAVAWDAERDDKRPRFVVFQIPGMWRGAPRGMGLVPAGSIEVQVDGAATATIAHGAGSFATDPSARALAAEIEAALRAAAWTEGGPVTNPARLAELARVSCRWDPRGRTLVVASGRAGAVDDPVRVPVAPTYEPAPAAPPVAPPDPFLVPTEETRSTLASAVRVVTATPALGLSDGVALPTRLTRQRRPPTRAVNVDARIELWAGSQPELGELVDVLFLSVPTRGALAVRPGLLGADVAAGATTLTLLEEGLPSSPWSLAHLEAGDGPVDRVAGESWAGGAADTTGLVLAAGSVARLRTWLPPLYEDARIAANPFEAGLAATVGFSFAPGAPAGAFDLLTIGDAATLRVTLGSDTVTVTATVRFVGGAQRVFDRRVTYTPPATAPAGTAEQQARATPLLVHLRLNPASGACSLAVELLSDVAHTLTSPIGPPGAVRAAPAGTFDLALALGGAGGVGVTVWHLHVAGTPMAAPSADNRRLVWGASRLQPGDSVHLADTRDGAIPSGRRFDARIRSVVGSVVELDRPVPEAWSKRSTLVHGEEFFFQQLRLSRKDDLLNHLFRVSIDYRVSAWLDERLPETSPALVLEPRLRVNDLDPIDTVAATGVSAVVPPS
ncbi:MAG: hypothetical protein V4850_08715 [Myxococcota bacterium]